MKQKESVLKRTRDAWLDWRWGGRLLGQDTPTRFANKGAYNTEDTSYDVLKYLFKLVAPRPDDVIVDVGCGRGRVINYLLSRGLKNRIYGLELDPDVASDTAERLARHRNVSIVSGNAIENLPQRGTLFYLYNPFAEFVVRRLNAKLLSLPAADKVRVIYYNCLHVDPFLHDPAWRVEMHQVPGRRQAAFIRPTAEDLLNKG